MVFVHASLSSKMQQESIDDREVKMNLFKNLCYGPLIDCQVYGDGAGALLTDNSALSGTVWLMLVHGLRM
jgi:hypothetical protein